MTINSISAVLKLNLYNSPPEKYRKHCVIVARMKNIIKYVQKVRIITITNIVIIKIFRMLFLYKNK